MTLILAIVVLAVSVSPALAQVVVIPSVDSSLEPPCLNPGPVEAAIADFVELTPCDLRVVSD